MKMRIVSIACIVFVFVAAVSHASWARGKWEGGLKGGLNVSKFRGDAVAPWFIRPNGWLSGSVHDEMAGFVGGALVRRQMTDRFAVQVEALYSQKGGDGTVYGLAELVYPSNVVYLANISGTLTLRLDYVEFPLLAAFTFPAYDKVGFTVL
jgi:hypothetical protein